MTRTAKGYVTYSGSNKFGQKTLYSFRVGTEEKFFGTGTVDPKLNKNDYIEFEYTENNGKFSVDVASIKHISLSESSTDTPARSGTGGFQRSTDQRYDKQYWSGREKRDIQNDSYRKENDLRIQYQSARNAAIDVVDLLLRERILKLADGPKADNVGVVMGKISDITDDFFRASSAVGMDSVRSDVEHPVFETDSDIPFEPTGKVAGSDTSWT